MTIMPKEREDSRFVQIEAVVVGTKVHLLARDGEGVVWFFSAAESLWKSLPSTRGDQSDAAFLE
jgi:hypothetical protein